MDKNNTCNNVNPIRAEYQYCFLFNTPKDRDRAIDLFKQCGDYLVYGTGTSVKIVARLMRIFSSDLDNLYNMCDFITEVFKHYDISAERLNDMPVEYIGDEVHVSDTVEVISRITYVDNDDEYDDDDVVIIDDSGYGDPVADEDEDITIPRITESIPRWYTITNVPVDDETYERFMRMCADMKILRTSYHYNATYGYADIDVYCDRNIYDEIATWIIRNYT